jgi:hypothetical protein
MNKIASMGQVWRVVRLFGVSFGHAAWIGALGLDWPSRTALVGIAVGATEGAYRAAFPAGNERTVGFLHELADLISKATSTNTQVTVQGNATVTSTDEGHTVAVDTIN